MSLSQTPLSQPLRQWHIQTHIAACAFDDPSRIDLISGSGHRCGAVSPALNDATQFMAYRTGKGVPPFAWLREHPVVVSVLRRGQVLSSCPGDGAGTGGLPQDGCIACCQHIHADATSLAGERDDIECCLAATLPYQCRAACSSMDCQSPRHIRRLSELMRRTSSVCLLSC